MNGPTLEDVLRARAWRNELAAEIKAIESDTAALQAELDEILGAASIDSDGVVSRQDFNEVLGAQAWRRLAPQERKRIAMRRHLQR